MTAVVTSPSAQQRSIDDFFAAFTADWIRQNPNQAASTRFFTGEEQRQFERQITPLTPEWRRARVTLAERSLDELNRIAKASSLTDSQRVSADLMRWQLETFIRSDRYSDYFFPFEQFGGANVGLVSLMTVSHPLVTEADAANYVARLGQFAPRLDEAIAEARRIAALGFIPPRFIVRATLAQMQQFVASPPAQNPLVASFASRMATAQCHPRGTARRSWPPRPRRSSPRRSIPPGSARLLSCSRSRRRPPTMRACGDSRTAPPRMRTCCAVSRRPA